MGVLTSIAELIAKGYPEEVAQRIASGELPMDEASRLARASDQGYGGVLYRGHVEGNPPRSNQDMYMSDQQPVADTYARGGEYYDEATDSYKIAQGSTVPLRTNASNLLEKDAGGLSYEDVYLDRSDVPDMEWMDYQRSSDKTDGIAAAIKDEGTRQGVLFRDIVDDFDGTAESTSNVYNILGSRPDVNIRHADAAYDPQYKGSNIMGEATVPGLAATAAGGGALATIAANLQSIIPESTMGALYDMGLVDSAIGAGDTAVRAGQDVINEVALGGTMLKNAIADTDSQPWELDIDPETEQGSTMVGALTEDLGRLLNYGGAFGNMPSGMDMIQGGVDAYKKYIQPHLSDRVEEGLGGAGILAASLMGVKKVPTRTVGEEIRTDVYDPSQVAKGGIETPYSQNPVLANIDLDGPRPGNIAAGQWKRRQAQMDDPVIRAREEARPEGGLAVGTDNLEAGLLSYEDLARENTPLTWLPADGTMVGEVRQVGGRQIKPVAVNGGPLHADKYNSWMSMNGAAYTKQKHAQNILSETGESPMYMHLNMGNEGSNFSHMPSEIWTNYVDKYPMHGAGWDALNKRMSSLPDKGDTKGVSADWAKSGIDSPEGLRNFLLPQYGAEAANSTLGNRRKIFMDTVAKAGVQDAGGPIVNDIYSGLIEPGLLGKQGMAGYRGMLSVDAPPAGLLAEPNRHPSYNTVIPGNGVFTFKEGIVPADVMFPDAFNAAHRADKLPHQRFRSVQTNGTEYQIADQQWLDGIMGYLYSQNQ